jgi:hypothetical protein
VKRLLVLYSYPKAMQMRRAVRDHLHALDGGAERIVYHDAFGEPPRRIRGLEFDGVVLHTTFLCERWSDQFADVRRRYAWLSDVPCTKVALPQDEYDHSEVLDEWLSELGVSDVFTVLGEDVRPVLYPTLHERAHFHPALTGYIDDAMASYCAAHLRPTSDRAFDIVYRATRLPYWFGSHGQLKHKIAEIVGERLVAHDLRADISTEWDDTIFGDAWSDFLMSGRAIIGAESGSSVLDRRGEIQSRIRTLLAEQPALSFEEVGRELPEGWDSCRFFAISPRHLEAVVTKTAQVLVEGTYSGVLEAERHYIPLRPDFSNLDDVLERLHDHRLLQETADRAYEEIYVGGAYRYSDFAAALRAALDMSAGPIRPFRSAAFPAVAAANHVMAAPLFVARRAGWRLRRLASAVLRRAGLRSQRL